MPTWPKARRGWRRGARRSGVDGGEAGRWFLCVPFCVQDDYALAWLNKGSCDARREEGRGLCRSFLRCAKTKAGRSNEAVKSMCRMYGSKTEASRLLLSKPEYCATWQCYHTFAMAGEKVWLAEAGPIHVSRRVSGCVTCLRLRIRYWHVPISSIERLKWMLSLYIYWKPETSSKHGLYEARSASRSCAIAPLHPPSRC